MLTATLYRRTRVTLSEHQAADAPRTHPRSDRFDTTATSISGLRTDNAVVVEWAMTASAKRFLCVLHGFALFQVRNRRTRVPNHSSSTYHQGICRSN
jgi:hypothetical protein